MIPSPGCRALRCTCADLHYFILTGKMKRKKIKKEKKRRKEKKKKKKREAHILS